MRSSIQKGTYGNTFWALPGFWGPAQPQARPAYLGRAEKAVPYPKICFAIK